MARLAQPPIAATSHKRGRFRGSMGYNSIDGAPTGRSARLRELGEDDRERARRREQPVRTPRIDDDPLEMDRRPREARVGRNPQAEESETLPTRARGAAEEDGDRPGDHHPRKVDGASEHRDADRIREGTEEEEGRGAAAALRDRDPEDRVPRNWTTAERGDRRDDSAGAGAPAPERSRARREADEGED